LRKVVVFQITKILLLTVPRKVITLDSVANTAVTNVRPFQGEENKQKNRPTQAKWRFSVGFCQENIQKDIW